MQSLKKITTLRIFIMHILLLIPLPLWAQSRYFDISLNGSYQQNYSTYYNTQKFNIGAELSIPLNNIVDIAAGQTFLHQTLTYSEAYRTWYMLKYGLTDAQVPKKLQIIETTQDTSLNASVGYTLGFIKPAIFGGKLWRKSCTDGFLYEQKTCSNLDTNLWNAGLSMQIFVTWKLRLRLLWRISPSTRSEGDNQKTYDSLYSIGLMWGI